MTASVDRNPFGSSSMSAVVWVKCAAIAASLASRTAATSNTTGRASSSRGRSLSFPNSSSQIGYSRVLGWALARLRPSFAKRHDARWSQWGSRRQGNKAKAGLNSVIISANWATLLSHTGEPRAGMAASGSARKLVSASSTFRRRNASTASSARRATKRLRGQVREPGCDAPPSVTKTKQKAVPVRANVATRPPQPSDSSSGWGATTNTLLWGKAASDASLVSTYGSGPKDHWRRQLLLLPAPRLGSVASDKYGGRV